MAEKLPWIPWYARDMMNDDKIRTLLIEDSKKWWFMVLIQYQWDHFYIPLQPQQLRAVVSPAFGTPAKWWESFVDVVPVFFPAQNGDAYLGQNQRLEEIREQHVGEHERKVEKARLAGQASGAARREKSTSQTQDEP